MLKLKLKLQQEQIKNQEGGSTEGPKKEGGDKQSQSVFTLSKTKAAGDVSSKRANAAELRAQKGN